MIGVVRNLFLLALLTLGASSGGYEGYKVYQVTPHTLAQAKLLHQLHNDPNFDFFKDSRLIDEPSDVMVAPQVQWYFEEALKNLSAEGLTYKVLVEDVQIALDQESEEPQEPQISPRASSALFTEFQSHAQINAYLESLARDYPSIVRLESLGRSYEGRDLLLIHIGRNRNNPTIFIDAGIHAREWIAPPAALYLINQLVENPDYADLHQHVSWTIIPSLNPDGYEFSRSATRNRLWRKSRSPNERSTCIGKDPNRNFGFHWMEAGASQAPCDEIYAGPAAFSEPETEALRQYFLEHGRNIKLYVSIHSYGNYILYPWGYTSAYPPDADELQALGEEAGRAIQRASTIGSRYSVGSSTNLLYAAAGGSDDWVKGVAGVELSYTFELPGGGSAGFNPPASQILPIVRETFESFRVLGSYVEAKFT